MSVKYSSKIKLDSKKIPFEIRRNIPDIYNFQNVYYYDNKFHYYTEKKQDLKHCVSKHLANQFKIDTKIIHQIEKCLIIDTAYIFWPMSLNNIGHTMYDNFLPIYKLMVLDQETFDINKNNTIYLVRRLEETENEQKLRNKQKELLKVFSNNIEFINKIKQPIFIKNCIMQKTNMKPRPWKEYDVKLKKDDINKEFLKCFIKKIKEAYNIENVENPNKIIYLSRSGARWRKVQNEDKLIKRLKESNYDIELVKFEKLSLKEEISLMNNTKIFIAPYGAGVMASSCFLPTTSTCMIINPIGFTFKHDFPTMLVTFTERLDINLIKWINDIGRSGKNIYASRDANMKINVNKVLEFMQKI